MSPTLVTPLSSQLPPSDLVCPVFFLNLPTNFCYSFGCQPLEGVTRGGLPPPPSDATAALQWMAWKTWADTSWVSVGRQLCFIDSQPVLAASGYLHALERRVHSQLCAKVKTRSLLTTNPHPTTQRQLPWQPASQITLFWTVYILLMSWCPGGPRDSICYWSSGVTRRGWTAPGDTIQRGGGVTPEWKKIASEFTKNTGQHNVGRWELWSCDENTAKNGHQFLADYKKEKRSPVFLRENRGDTVSCRPGWHQP